MKRGKGFGERENGEGFQGKGKRLKGEKAFEGNGKTRGKGKH